MKVFSGILKEKERALYENKLVLVIIYLSKISRKNSLSNSFNLELYYQNFYLNYL